MSRARDPRDPALEEDSSRESKRAQRLEALSHQRDLQVVLGTPEGRRVWRGLIGWCGVYGDGFSTNALTMAAAAGRRGVGLHLINEALTASPDLYLRMEAEAQPKKENPDD